MRSAPNYFTDCTGKIQRIFGKEAAQALLEQGQLISAVSDAVDLPDGIIDAPLCDLSSLLTEDAFQDLQHKGSRQPVYIIMTPFHELFSTTQLKPRKWSGNVERVPTSLQRKT